MIANPAVRPSMSAVDAARAHLDRYGAAFGTQRPGTSLHVLDTTRSASGDDVVRFSQRVSGLPVIGGQMVVVMGPGRQLGSALATFSATTKIPAAVVDETPAARTAASSAAKAAGMPGPLPVHRQGQWVWDPGLFGAPAPFGARGVWRFSVGDGVDVQRLVLVDDRTGAVLLNIDEHQEVLDRIVCDRNNVDGADTPCTPGAAARTESSGPSAVADVNAAFDHAGSTSAFYQAVAGVDLTQLLGVDVGGGVKKLASTVRYCPVSADPQTCPFANAFWNGTQMFYGQGYAVADDVVGHEMTHGVISKNADLFYWGQSGALNESLADIMGEIVDHRFGLVAGDSDWELAEDLPGGAIRDMKDPTSFGDPDRTGRPLWFADTLSYGDGGGVHFNSGVGNKTAFLISQGGTFNGQTVTGIDGADATLDKTAHLFYDAIVKLTSCSDYANLADVLEQSCATFASAGLHGFTAADCTSVGMAVLATQLRTTPTNAPQPADALKTCPAGTTFRELFNSETGNPASKFTTGGEPAPWSYGINGDWGSNAVSGKTSWFSYDPDPGFGDPTTIAMSSTALGVPPGQATYLWFQQWRLFEWYVNSGNHYDGGVVEVDDLSTPAGPVDTSGGAWVNGPQQTLVPHPGNPHGARTVFGGDSFGWTASRLDLSGFAGRDVRLRFAALGDNSDSLIGWWLDDITVYTCDSPLPSTPSAPSAPTVPRARGKLGKAVVTWQAPSSNAGLVTGFRVSTAGKSVTVAASARRAVVKGLKQGRTYTFTIEPLAAGGLTGAVAQATAKATKVTLKASVANGKTKLSGQLLRGGKGLKNKALKVLARKKGTWVKVGSVTTGKGGSYALKLAGVSSRPYRVVFRGALGLMGSQSPKRGL